MTRATTPTHVFKLDDISPAQISKILITYAQDGDIILEKTEANCTLGTDSISVKLTQAETLLFHSGKVEIQMRVLTTDGTALASGVFSVAVSRVLNDEVLS